MLKRGHIADWIETLFHRAEGHLESFCLWSDDGLFSKQSINYFIYQDSASIQSKQYSAKANNIASTDSTHVFVGWYVPEYDYLPMALAMQKQA